MRTRAEDSNQSSCRGESSTGGEDKYKFFPQVVSFLTWTLSMSTGAPSVTRLSTSAMNCLGHPIKPKERGQPCPRAHCRSRNADKAVRAPRIFATGDIRVTVKPLMMRASQAHECADRCPSIAQPSSQKSKARGLGDIARPDTCRPT